MYERQYRANYVEYPSNTKEKIKKKLDKIFPIIKKNVENNNNYLNLLLEFFTNSRNLPVNGYAGYLPERAQFIFSNYRGLATAHTCFKQMEFPKVLFEENADPSLETALGEFVLGSESNALMTAGGNIIYRKYLKYKYKYIKLKRIIKNKKY